MSHLIIRADSTAKIGAGHIMRCLALAQAWQDQGGKVTFISHCESNALKERIQNEGFRFISIDNICPESSDLVNTLSLLKNESMGQKPWLILDGYHFTPDYHQAIRDAGIHLLVIDDTHHLPYYHTDVLLNQNIYARNLRYHSDEDTIHLLGMQYVLLRREFLRCRDFKRQISQQARKILVTFGGADSGNVTLKVIEALKLLDINGISVNVVVGPANPHRETLREALTSAHFEADLLINPPSMSELIKWADLAISAAGSSCWEFTLLGLPSIVVVVAENQRLIAKGLNEAGIVLNMGPYQNISNTSLTKSIEQMLGNEKMRAIMSARGRVLLDGEGSQRVINTLNDW